MRILLAEPKSSVRYGIAVLLGEQPGLTLIGAVRDAAELLTQLKAARPEVLLLSWELPGAAPVVLMAQLRTARPELRIIVLSGRNQVRAAALQAGADAFVSKTMPPEKLLQAIDKVGGALQRPDAAAEGEIRYASDIEIQ